MGWLRGYVHKRGGRHLSSLSTAPMSTLASRESRAELRKSKPSPSLRMSSKTLTGSDGMGTSNSSCEGSERALIHVRPLKRGEGASEGRTIAENCLSVAGGGFYKRRLAHVFSTDILTTPAARDGNTTRLSHTRANGMTTENLPRTPSSWWARGPSQG